MTPDDLAALSALSALSDRLDKQAAAIKRLRADRDALLERVVALEGAGAVSATPSTTDGTDHSGWVPKPECLTCGRPKEAGRNTLTCRPCGAQRNKIITTPGADRSALANTECAQCGAAKPLSTRMLCSPCTAAFKVWKAAH